jgi:small nuclear ribonucleoprotein (snRNP)-like protein
MKTQTTNLTLAENDTVLVMIDDKECRATVTGFDNVLELVYLDLIETTISNETQIVVNETQIVEVV